MAPTLSGSASRSGAPPPIAVTVGAGPTQVNDGSLFRQGFLSAATNPKGLLFLFAAVAATYAVTEFLVESILASAANRIRPWLERAGQRFNRVCGGVFVALGVVLPLQP